MSSPWVPVRSFLRLVAPWGLLFAAFVLSGSRDHWLLGAVAATAAGFFVFLRGYRLGASHERRRQALETNELDVDLEGEPEPEVPAVTSDGHRLH